MAKSFKNTNPALQFISKGNSLPAGEENSSSEETKPKHSAVLPRAKFNGELRDRRTQLLFKQSVYKRAEYIAKKRKCSVNNLIETLILECED